MNNDAPTLGEITQLTRQELTTASKTDPIRECGRAALSLLPNDHDTSLKLAYQKLHDVPYKDVKTCWRRLYTDASLWKVVELVEEHGKCSGCGAHEHVGEDDTKRRDWINEVIKMLDMALILTGAPAREEIVELWFSALKAMIPFLDSTDLEQTVDSFEPPSKRRKFSGSSSSSRLPPGFPTTLLTPSPTLLCPLPRTRDFGLTAFQTKISNIATHTPMIIEGALQHWPALDERPWSSPGYLLEQTLGGRRLVPVEVGKSYTDESWGQKIVTFKVFMETYMLEEDPERKSDGETQQIGYLAQHDLFVQVPPLRADISIPDYCYCDPAPSIHLTHIKATPKLEEPLLNAWFGPTGTVSPLHTDPYHNILAQVVGYKYVRLYAPEETEKLYPRSLDEHGVDMSNTSQVDLDKVMKVWTELSCWQDKADTNEFDREAMENSRMELEEQYPKFRNARYIEGILGPGECLYLPIGWWHYIRSLTPSFSVSFWFN